MKRYYADPLVIVSINELARLLHVLFLSWTSLYYIILTKNIIHDLFLYKKVIMLACNKSLYANLYVILFLWSKFVILEINQSLDYILKSTHIGVSVC